jgi:hypothetical protein
VDGVVETIEPLVLYSSATDPAGFDEGDCVALAARSALLFAMALSLALFQLIDEGDEVVFIGTAPGTVIDGSMEDDLRSTESGTRFEGVVENERPATEVPASTLTPSSLRFKRATDAAPSIGVGEAGTLWVCAPTLELDRLTGIVTVPVSTV